MKTAVSKGSDWELDFYSRPILGADGRKRWELLITTTPSSEDGDSPFRFAKVCPSTEVNSLWLSSALSEAREQALQAGYGAPVRCAAGAVRCEPWCNEPPPNKTSK